MGSVAIGVVFGKVSPMVVAGIVSAALFGAGMVVVHSKPLESIPGIENQPSDQGV